MSKASALYKLLLGASGLASAGYTLYNDFGINGNGNIGYIGENPWITAGKTGLALSAPLLAAGLPTLASLGLTGGLGWQYYDHNRKKDKEPSEEQEIVPPQGPYRTKTYENGLNEDTASSSAKTSQPTPVVNKSNKQNVKNGKSQKTRVLYSDAKADTDEYKQIKSSNDFTRSYKDYANRKDLTDAQKEQRAVADVMAWRKQYGK